MSTENTDNVENTNVEQEIDVNKVLEENKQLQAEAAKYRNLKKSLATERDELKAKLNEVQTGSQTKEDNFKQLYQEQLELNQKYLSEKKESSINEAIKAKLLDQGVNDKTLTAALKLVDKSLISTDEELDSIGIDAAVLKLRKDYDFLFEKKVPPSNPKLPGKEVPNNSKVMTRADFDKLSPAERGVYMAKGYTFVD